MARVIKRTWFISIDFRFKKDANYDKRLKDVKDYFKEIGFVEGDTTSSLIIFDDDNFLESQIKIELKGILRKSEDSNFLDVVIIRSVVNTTFREKGKTRRTIRHTISILDKNEMMWRRITERGLYKKLLKESKEEYESS